MRGKKRGRSCRCKKSDGRQFSVLAPFFANVGARGDFMGWREYPDSLRRLKRRRGGKGDPRPRRLTQRVLWKTRPWGRDPRARMVSHQGPSRARRWHPRGCCYFWICTQPPQIRSLIRSHACASYTTGDKKEHTQRERAPAHEVQRPRVHSLTLRHPPPPSLTGTNSNGTEIDISSPI